VLAPAITSALTLMRLQLVAASCRAMFSTKAALRHPLPFLTSRLKYAVVLLLLSSTAHADFCYRFANSQDRFQPYTGSCNANWTHITDYQAVDILQLHSALTSHLFQFDAETFALIFFGTITLYVIGMGIGWSIKYLNIVNVLISDACTLL